MDLFTTSNITFVIFVIGTMFAVYLYFRKPQEELDKRQALDQSDAEGKAALLSQQVQWEKDSNAIKFTEFSTRLDTAMTLAQNHIHTVDTKVDALSSAMNVMSNEIIRLATVIEERIPRK